MPGRDRRLAPAPPPASPPTASSTSTLGRRRRAADVLVQRGGAIAELEHLAEHGDRAAIALRASPSTSSARFVAVGFAL